MCLSVYIWIAEDILYDALKHGEWEYEEGDQEAEEISRELFASAHPLCPSILMYG